MKMLVDADACPGAVKEILFRAAERVRVPLTLVANRRMSIPPSERISIVAVSGGPDAADDRIAELAQPGDLVVTADVPLADRVVTKGGYALDPRGRLYTEANVKRRLAMRDLMEALRDRGHVSGGPSSFGPKDAQAFANQLDRFLTRRAGT